MLCEQGMTTAEVRNALSVPHNTKQTLPTKTQSNTGKTNKHCINCGMMNHNVQTYKKKKEQTMVATTGVAQPSQKTHMTSSYACHTYGLNRHKMIDCPKFVKMQKMFHGKSIQHVVETQTITANVNVVDVNLTTRSKVTKEHVFKDREPRKTKSVIDQEKDKWLKNQWWRQFNRFRKHRPRHKGHLHPWKDGTQLGQVC